MLTTKRKTSSNDSGSPCYCALNVRAEEPESAVRVVFVALLSEELVVTFK